MRLRALVLFGAVGLLGIGDDEEPGWLATALASTDPDVEAAIAAYEAGDYETATSHLDAAVARRGERSELYYDRGLLLLAQGAPEGARTAFQHGTESGDIQVRASSNYELGNLAMAAEEWDVAIAAYIDCLRTLPDHQNAKWNLELAQQRKREQEEQQQQQQDQQDQQDQQQNQDGEQGEQDQQEQDQDQQEQDQQEQEQDQQGQEQGEPEQDQQEQDQQEQEQGEQQQQQQEQEQGEPQELPAQPLEPGELDAALDELDRQDAFMFGRPRGSKREVEKDW